VKVPLRAIVGLALLGGCSAAASDQELRRGALWAAASECASGKQASIKIDRVDDDGRVHVRVLQGGAHDVPAFNACFNQRAPEKLAAAGRASSPARIAESGPATESSGARPSSRATSVAIHMVNNRFLVPVVLNEDQQATFLLDTGASITVVTPELARRAALELPAGASKSKARMASGQEVEVSVVRVRSIRVGTARIDNLGVAVYAIGVIDSSAKPPLAVDGLLGADFIGRFTTTLDPKAGTLTLQLDDAPAR
jgi:predicted aspartyl protease